MDCPIEGCDGKIKVENQKRGVCYLVCGVNQFHYWQPGRYFGRKIGGF